MIIVSLDKHDAPKRWLQRKPLPVYGTVAHLGEYFDEYDALKNTMEISPDAKYLDATTYPHRQHQAAIDTAQMLTDPLIAAFLWGLLLL